ncbi:hypothetical protein [Streptomyces sp. CAU 1734]|uniref:hypothetical protein n=1 Tax=Streptomyces sp. CAU 1734 TaxID=3140360 RepID=UPI0032618E38
MSLAPRAVLVHRTSEYEELLARHGTHGQAGFFLSSRGRAIEEPAARHLRARRTLAEVAAAVPLNWRQARVERADLDRFLFGPEDVVVVVGTDGLVANAAKYLSGQPVVGIDTEPGRGLGVLVRHRPEETARLLAAAVSGSAVLDELTMVEAVADNTERIRALNEIYLGRSGHQSARYRLTAGAGTGRGGPGADPGATEGAGRERTPVSETQASSGVLVGTGTGATGWLRSLWRERSSGLPLPGPADPRLLWFVREAWPSPATGASLVAGVLERTDVLRLTVESDRLVAFGDGVESDALELTWGQSIRLGVAETRLRLLI